MTTKAFFKCRKKLIQYLNAVIHFANFAFSRFVEDGVNFSINSDDPLICQTRLDIEQGVAFNQIGLSPAELTRGVSCLSKSNELNLDASQKSGMYRYYLLTL